MSARRGPFYCVACRQWLPSTPEGSCTTGYGVREDVRKVCFACCAKLDAERARETGRAMFYAGEGELTNWPGTLRIPLPIGSTRVSRHNIARVRVDYWFTWQGRDWHGVRYGTNTSIVHCRRLAS